MTSDNNMMGLEHGNVEVFDPSLSRICLNLRDGNLALRSTWYNNRNGTTAEIVRRFMSLSYRKTIDMLLKTYCAEPGPR